MVLKALMSVSLPLGPVVMFFFARKARAAATRNEHSVRQAAEAFGADRRFFDPFAMIDETAARRYTVAPDIQSLFQWQ